MKYQATTEVMEKLVELSEASLFTPEVREASLEILRNYQTLSVEEMTNRLFILAAEVASNTATMITCELFDEQSVNDTLDVMYEQETANLDEELRQLIDSLS